MLLANKEAVMTVLDTLNFVAFNPLQNNNLNRYQFSRHLAASVDNALHTLQATADYWNCAVVCCYKTFQSNQKYHS